MTGQLKFLCMVAQGQLRDESQRRFVVHWCPYKHESLTFPLSNQKQFLLPPQLHRLSINLRLFILNLQPRNTNTQYRNPTANLPVCLSVFVCLSVCLSKKVFVCLSVCVCLSILSMCLSVCLSVNVFVCLCLSAVCLSMCLSVCLKKCLSVYLSVCLFPDVVVSV